MNPEPSQEPNDKTIDRSWHLDPAKDLGLTAVQRAKSLHREPGFFSFMVRNIWWAILQWFLKVWTRYEISGHEKIPKGLPFIMIANHSSHLDVVLLTLCVPVKLRSRLFALAAEDHFFRKVSSSFFTSIFINALPMSRDGGGKGRESLDIIQKRLVDEHCGIIVFPEGTRSRSGQMGTFKSGIGNLIGGTSVPVVPCYIDGAFSAFPAGKFLPRRHKIHVRIGQPLTFQHVKRDKDGCASIALSLQSAVTKLSLKSE